MALIIIATIIALAALAVAIVANARLTAESERLKDEINGLGVDVKILKDAVDAEDKEIPIAGLEGVSFDPETTTMTIEGNLVVRGGVAAGGIIKED